MSKTVPKHLWNFFWDVDPQTLDPNQKANFVIGRLLEKGNDKAVSWVLHNYPLKTIKHVFSTIRDFSPKTANFWSIYLGIPEDEILCLQEPYRSQRKRLWPY